VLDFAREKLFDPVGIDSRPAAQPLAKEEYAHLHDAADFACPVVHASREARSSPWPSQR
jgi:hypothetical protein